MLNNRRQVCIKKMYDRAQFEAEINGRFSKFGGKPLPAGCVISVIGWHTPSSEPFQAGNGQSQEAEEVSRDMDTSGGRYTYILVMERGERSLHDACAKGNLILNSIIPALLI